MARKSLAVGTIPTRECGEFKGQDVGFRLWCGRCKVRGVTVVFSSIFMPAGRRVDSVSLLQRSVLSGEVRSIFSLVSQQRIVSLSF